MKAIAQYNRYRAIFDRFDALHVGLTATPTVFIDHNTFHLFGCADGVVKPKVTRPVSMLEMLMQHAPELGYCIVLQMHVVSAHREHHGVVRDCTPLASW